MENYRFVKIQYNPTNIDLYTNEINLYLYLFFWVVFLIIYNVFYIFE
jgi:hypothetical protein